MFCNPQCLVDIFCNDLMSCKVTLEFIKSISPQFSGFDEFYTRFCTLLNVPLHDIGSCSSDYEKEVRMFQEWQSHSQGTYQCLRQQMDKYSIFCGRNILVHKLYLRSHLLLQTIYTYVRVYGSAYSKHALFVVYSVQCDYIVRLLKWLTLFTAGFIHVICNI